MHIIVNKYIASRYGCQSTFELWKIERFGIGKSKKFPRSFLGIKINSLQIGIILSILIAFLSLGKFPFVAIATFSITVNEIHRIGRKYFKLTEAEEMKISVSGPLANLFLAFIFEILTLTNVFNFSAFVKINALIAVFQMLPFPSLPGSKVFFGSKTFYVFNFAFILISTFFLLADFSIIATIILALIFSIILALNYHYFFHYR